MSATALSIIGRVKTITTDSGAVFWGHAAAQEWLNEARKLIAILKPDEVTATMTMALAASSVQSVPSNALALIEVLRNVGGPVVTLAERKDLNLIDPNWMSATGTWVQHYMFDEKFPRRFWIYPRPTGAVTIEMLCSAEPTPVDVYRADGTLNPVATKTDVDVQHDAALVDYILARQFQQQHEGESQARAASHMKSFYMLLGMVREAEAWTNPNRPVAPSVANEVTP